MTDNDEDHKIDHKNNNMLAILFHLSLFLPIVFSFVIEKYLAVIKEIPRLLIFFLIVLNTLCLTIIAPVAVILQDETNPVISISLLSVSTVIFLKLLSFHHVWHDVRFYYKK